MALRIFLFAGLVLHKLVWEVMKKRGRRIEEPRPSHTPSSPLKAAVKIGKVGVLGFLLIQTLFLKAAPIRKRPRAIHLSGVILFTAGLATAIIGRLQLGENWVDLEDYQVGQKQSLVTHGIYGHVRHPIYAGDLIMLTGLQLALNSWLILGVPALALVVIRQARAEERILQEAFPDYRAYQRQSKMLIPFIL